MEEVQWEVDKYKLKCILYHSYLLVKLKKQQKYKHDMTNAFRSYKNKKKMN